MIMKNQLFSLENDDFYDYDITKDIIGKQQFYTDLKVALHLFNIVEAAKFMLAFDGFAKKIVIISHTFSISKASKLIEQSKSDILISDNLNFLKFKNDDVLFFNSYKQFRSFFENKDNKKHTNKTEWVLSTSGTTGTPKLVSHTFSSLTRTTKENNNNFHYNWGMIYDYSRYAGLQVFLQSTLSNGTLIVPEYATSLKKKIELFIEKKCTHLSATPTIWRQILMIDGIEKLNLKQVTLGGEISDEKILYSLSKVFSKARITNIFASTEAGVGISVNDKKPGFPKKYLFSPPLGIGLKIKNDRLFIKNEFINRKYDGTNINFISKDGWVDTGDIVTIKNNRILFLGRANGVINVGGENVYPEEIEDTIFKSNLVTQAKVGSVKNPITGSLVIAEIVLKNKNNDKTVELEKLNNYLSKNLERHKIPVKISVVKKIDYNSGGKLMRN